jgi:hypothetical protein
VVPGVNGATAGSENRLVRTRSRDCSDRTTSPPLTSAPRTPGGKATSAISSSTCSEAYLGSRHPPRSSNRAVVTVAWDLALPIRADLSGCADGRRNVPLSLSGPLRGCADEHRCHNRRSVLLPLRHSIHRLWPQVRSHGSFRSVSVTALETRRFRGHSLPVIVGAHVYLRGGGIFKELHQGSQRRPSYRIFNLPDKSSHT